MPIRADGERLIPSLFGETDLGFVFFFREVRAGLEMVRSRTRRGFVAPGFSTFWGVLEAVASIGIFFFSFLVGDVSMGLDNARDSPRWGGGGSDVRVEAFFLDVVF